MEQAFLAALDSEIGSRGPVDPARVGDLFFQLEAEDEGVSLARQLELEADLERFREFVVHRSLYQLKEADPHSWAIPRLIGPAKTALLEVQGDEYGGGRPERIHSVLFAKTMRALGLDDRENAYLDRIPGVTLATVNLMSALGLRRSRRGAIVGHLAMFEMTSALPNRRYGNALRRLGFDAEATDFYDEHVEADAVHENIAAYDLDLAGGLARQEPELAADILYGARALLCLEGPLRWTEAGPIEELASYLRDIGARGRRDLDCRWLAATALRAPRGRPRRYRSAPAAPPNLSFQMGKVNGVLTGVRESEGDLVVIADDDIRYDRASLRRTLALLAEADLVRLQNYFDELPWHARWDTARSLLNRVFTGDPAARPLEA
jgi:hypothetical protein